MDETEIRFPVLLIAHREAVTSCNRCYGDDDDRPSVFETQRVHTLADLEKQLLGYLANDVDVLVYSDCEQIAEVEMSSSWRGSASPLVCYTEDDAAGDCGYGPAERAWESLGERLVIGNAALREAAAAALTKQREDRASAVAADHARREVRELERLRQKYPEQR